MTEIIEETNWNLSPYDEKALAEALHQCPCLRESSAREAVLKTLPPYIYLSLTRNPRQDIDMVYIVRSCCEQIGGLGCLIDLVHIYDNGKDQIRELDRLLQELSFQVIHWSELAELKLILRHLPRDIDEFKLQHCFSHISVHVRLAIEHDANVKLNRILDCLARRPIVNNKHVLLSFLVHLNEELAELDIKVQIEAWLQKVAQRLNLEDLAKKQYHPFNASTQDTNQENRYLLVKILPNSWNSNQFYVRGWLYRDKVFLESFVEEQLHTIDEIPKLLEKFIIKCYPLEIGRQTLLTIEFLLPRTLICYDIDQWKISAGRGRQQPIGVGYRIVVRSMERIYEEDMEITRNLWYERWTSYQSLATEKINSSILFCREDICKNLDTLYYNLKEDNIICLILPFAPILTDMQKIEDDILFTILNAGTPIVLWSRQASQHDARKLKYFKKHLLTYSIDSLPELVWKKRKEAARVPDEEHIGRYLTLLWDDPERLPPDVLSSYRAPMEVGD